MFEVQDLAVASPATVSRCGMVYLEPGILGLQPFVECWLKQLPDPPIYDYKDQLFNLFAAFLQVSWTIPWRNEPTLTNKYLFNCVMSVVVT